MCEFELHLSVQVLETTSGNPPKMVQSAFTETNSSLESTVVSGESVKRKVCFAARCEIFFGTYV